MENKVLFKSIYGSHLFGTSTPSSDRDYKQVHMSPTDLLLTGKYQKGFNKNTKPVGRNTAEDVDFESKELRHFIKEALSGQTYAIDLLFTPDSLILERSPEWDEILANRDKLTTNQLKPYIGYVTSQAAKYSKKGEKYNELIKVISHFEKYPEYIPLSEVVSTFDFSKYEYFKLYDKPMGVLDYKNENGEEIVRTDLYMDGPDCSFPCTRKMKDVLPVLRVKLDGFGRRVQDAASNNGLDLKAYYHALRIVWQMEEYLTTAHITFPSTRVQSLRDIRAGLYNKEYIETWIANEIERVLAIPNELPEPDIDFWNDWLTEKYMKQAYRQSRQYLRSKGLIK